MSLTADEVRRRVQRCKSLPSLPGVAIQLLEMWDDDDVSIIHVANALKNDPSLAAKLVKLANSPFYGWRAKVGSIERAVSVLGLNATMSLSLGFSLVRGQVRKAGSSFEYDTFWKRSAATAAAARTIGAHLRIPSLEELFLGGLLQDLGMLVLNEALPAEYEAVRAAGGGDHASLVRAEREAFGADHAELGGELVEKWGFPPNLVAAVRASHDPRAEQDLPERTTFARAIACGTLVADCFVGRVAHEDGRVPAARAAVALAPLLDADEEAVATVLHETGQAVTELAGALEITFESQEEVDGALEEAREALVMLNLKAELQARRTASHVDALEAERKELESRVSQDGLTKVLNRAGLDDVLERLFKQARRARGALALVFVDLDHFKRVNDNYGHQAGDAVLVEVARRVDASLRPSDHVGRYGGEEFLVVLPGANAAGGEIVAERLRAVIAAEKIDAQGTPLTVTASFGVAAVAGGSDFASVEELLKAADTALYEAKELGRNRVSVHRER